MEGLQGIQKTGKMGKLLNRELERHLGSFSRFFGLEKSRAKRIFMSYQKYECRKDMPYELRKFISTLRTLCYCKDLKLKEQAKKRLPEVWKLLRQKKEDIQRWLEDRDETHTH